MVKSNLPAISFIGFERGLREWRSLLVDQGFLVVHDAMSDLQRKVELTRTCGYTMLGQVELPPDVWWNGYYAPLKEQIEAMKRTGSVDQTVANEIKTAEKEIAEFDPQNDRFGSVFFVLKKT